MANSWRKQFHLTTWFGKKIENFSYGWIGLSILIIIFICSIYFWLASPYCQGTNNPTISFWDSLYFSVITFTTLGYGDLSPVGLGKAIASFEVLSGLGLVALFIGKVASERTSTILLLLYTSEHQRRLREFTNSIISLTESLSSSLDNYDHEKTKKQTKQLVRLIASTSSYLSFHSRHGQIANFGNISSFRMLYQAIDEAQLLALNALKIQETKEESRRALLQINERAVGIYSGMISAHNDVKVLILLNKIQRQSENYKEWVKSLNNGSTQWLHRGVISEALLEKVFNAMPPHPWPRNVHREIATALGITKKMAQRCIEILIARNKWPNFNIQESAEQGE